jgi:hypothetical protein
MRKKLALGLLICFVLATAIPYLLKTKKSPSDNSQKYLTNLPKPAFSSDSAFGFVARQVDFGPRTPGSNAQEQCARWLKTTFESYNCTVLQQNFTAPHYQGKILKGINLIAQYQPEKTRRILLAAHWDSRFMADKDTYNTHLPIAGADDGASGVAILLELARLLHGTPANIGVDFICFDLEDQGDDAGEPESWCLGSQYWAKNLHAPEYMPYKAVLLDMVGGKNARFYKEGISQQFAPTIVREIWGIAHELYHGTYFVNESRPGITDDHAFVIREAKIPMIDIISMPNPGEHPFPDYHHKHADNINVIDKNTLAAVGNTLTAFIYQNAAPVN